MKMNFRNTVMAAALVFSSVSAMAADQNEVRVLTKAELENTVAAIKLELKNQKLMTSQTLKQVENNKGFACESKYEILYRKQLDETLSVASEGTLVGNRILITGYLPGYLAGDFSGEVVAIGPERKRLQVVVAADGRSIDQIFLTKSDAKIVNKKTLAQPMFKADFADDSSPAICTKK